MAHIQPEDLQAMAPVGEIGLLRIALGGIARKARGDNQLRSGAQQLDSGLIPDLHTAAGEQRHAALQIGRLSALAKVELGASRA
jgi:hypothetical protein